MSKTTNLFHKLNYIQYIVTVTLIASTNVFSQHRENLYQHVLDYSGDDYEHEYREPINVGVYGNNQWPQIYNREYSADRRQRSSHARAYRSQLPISDLQLINDYIYGFKRRVPQSITSKKTVEMFPKSESQRIEHTSKESTDLTSYKFPTKLVYNLKPVRVHVQHNHIPGRPVEVQVTHTEERPHKVLHSVHRPVIHNVREILSPYLKVVQEILPVKETIQTIVANNDKYDGYSTNRFPPQYQYNKTKSFEQQMKTDVSTTSKDNSNDNIAHNSSRDDNTKNNDKQLESLSSSVVPVINSVFGKSFSGKP